MKLPMVVSVVVTGLLSACGGGSGGGQPGSPSTPQPQSYTIPAQSVNDFQSYAETGQYSGIYGAGNIQYRHVNVTTQVYADGSFSQDRVEDQDEQRTTYDYSGDGGIKAQVGTNCQYVYTPSLAEVPGTLTLGQTWSNSSTVGCAGSSTIDSTWSVTGSVVGIESVTVVAGTFSAIKTTVTSTVKYKSGSVSVSNNTCWRDTVTGYTVKCDMTNNYTPSGSSTGQQYKVAQELIGYAHALSGRQKLNVERFAGKWQATYTGAHSSLCAVDISAAGVISGLCFDVFGTSWDITGTVDAQGVTSFNLISGGSSGSNFSGTLVSPLKVAGTWRIGSDNGTWSMLHL